MGLLALKKKKKFESLKTKKKKSKSHRFRETENIHPLQKGGKRGKKKYIVVVRLAIVNSLKAQLFFFLKKK